MIIEELLEASADDIEKMSPEELAIYLKDIKSEEPLGLPLIVEEEKTKKPRKKKEKVETEKELSFEDKLKAFAEKSKEMDSNEPIGGWQGASSIEEDEDIEE